MPYLFVRPDGDRVEIAGPDAAHLVRSLRVRAGERIEAVDPGDGVQGWLLTIIVETVERDRVTGRVDAARPHRPEPETPVWLALALLPAAALEEALARCTELGAAGFVLIAAERSVARVPSAGKTARWASICREAAMLAGRLRVPEVRGPVPLREAAEFGAGELVLLDRRAERRLAELPAGPRTLAIGPEGGWTLGERAHAAAMARLGPRNLRAENAAAAALGVALSVAGDL